MRKISAVFFGFVLLCMTLVGVLPNNAAALGLKLAPLEYKTVLKQDERQQGFVDVSNPSDQAIKVKVSVQAFRQINDQGGLQFYDDRRIEPGIQTGLKEFELGAREALRMSFIIDGNTLPHGDVYAAIFFTTDVAQPRSGVGQLVRVGTMLSIVNQSPGSRKAEITSVSLPFLQLSDTAKGSYVVANTGPATNGFYPTVTINAWPQVGSKREQQSSLVFGGRKRSNDFSYQVGMGIHFVEVSYGNSKKGQWVVTVPAWALVVGLLVIIIVWIEIRLYRRRRKQRGRVNKNTTHNTSENTLL